jgi:multidrug efflux system membrane fusion protein
MRLRSSYIWAGLIALAVTAWMLSDDLLPSKNVNELEELASQNEKTGTDEKINSAVIVNAVKVKNNLTPLKIRASGVTRSKFEIDVIARRKGIIQEIVIKEGNWVNSGDILVRLDRGTLDADIVAARADRKASENSYQDAQRRFAIAGEHSVQLRSAEADLEVNKKNYQVAKKLVDSGHQTESVLSQKLALLRAAETRLFELKNTSKELELSTVYAQIKMIDARILQLEEQIKFTTIRAPQAGWLEILNIEKEEFIDENRPIAKIIGLQTLILDMPIPQTSIGNIDIGDLVEVNLTGVTTKNGKVEKIAVTANEATRTFNVEIQLDNKNGLLRAGMSAEANVIIDEVEAFKISPAHLNVDENGQLTVKVLNSEGRVEITPVDLVRTSGNLAYISGLENETLLLTSGQAFLRSGEKVNFDLITEAE